MSLSKSILRIQNPVTLKKQYFVSSRKLYNLVQADVSYKTFVEVNIVWSKLRENIDYHFNQKFDTYNLSICAV